MKNTFFILAIVLLSTLSTKSFANANALQGNTNTTFGNYSLTQSNEMVVINDVAYKTWTLSYSGTVTSYVVFYSPGTEGECCFTVRNEKFEIQYAKEGSNFGVRLVDPSKRIIKKKDVMDQIDYNKFVNQLVITSKEKTVEGYLGLVACFVPLLF